MRIILLVVCCMFGTAMAVPPSDASLKELIEITQSRQLLERSMAQMDSVMQTSMAQALQGKEVTPEMQQAMDDMRVRMVALMKQEMSWDVLEPMFIDIYQQSLTQEEVDGMLAFYKSEAGQAVIAKMPLIMQKTMQAMQQRMQVIMPKMQQIQNEALASLKARSGN